MDKKKKHNSKPKNKQAEAKEQKNLVNTVEKVTTEKTVEEKKVEKATTEKTDNLLIKVCRRAKNTSPESYRTLMFAGMKVALPVLAMIIVIATVVSLVQKKNEKLEEEAVAMTEAATEASVVVEPLEMDAYPNVNSIMTSYYEALATGDMETVKSHMDYINETDLLQLKNKNEFVESYNELNCYTRDGVAENSYFVYVTYKAKFKGFDTLVPGVTTHYVYPVEDGSLKIAKELDEEVNAALMVTSCQDDVVDIFNKVDVEYKEILATDENLNTFLTEMFTMAKTMTGEEIAKLEVGEETAQTEEATTVEVAAVEETKTESTVVVTDQPQTQIVDEEVKATTTVNVRSSDSENADKIGRLESGKKVKRIENKINGWSKIIYEGKEAYVKSTYLEVVSAQVVEEPANTTTETNKTETPSASTTTENKTETTPASTTKKEGTVTATTNVNVRNKPSTSSDTIGKATEGSSYKVIEDQGDWLKIEYKGQPGFVKAEYFN